MSDMIARPQPGGAADAGADPDDALIRLHNINKWYRSGSVTTYVLRNVTLGCRSPESNRGVCGGRSKQRLFFGRAQPPSSTCMSSQGRAILACHGVPDLDGLFEAAGQD